jgi:hypothetical protein
MTDFEILSCDKCGKSVGYYELNGSNWKFYCLDCKENSN